MEMKGNTLAIVLLVVGLVVGGGLGYFMAPTETVPGETTTVTVEKAPLSGETVRIGVIVSTTVALETAPALYTNMMQADYNAYAQKLGYDVNFNYLIDNADSQAAVHLEKVQGFKSMGIDVFLGGGWSSMAAAALSYCNDNDMLMWSSSSTSPLLAIEDDNLFRMCPDDTVQAPAISRMLESHGIKAIILIYRGDAWADGIVRFLEPDFVGRGGVIVEEIRYAGETTEFGNYLETAEQAAIDAVAQYGAEHVGVQIISFAEFVVMMTQAEDYPTIYGLTWFGSDGTSLSQQAADDAPTQVAHLKVFSTYAAPAETEKFTNLWDRYQAQVGQPFGYYSACAYDIGWLLTETILSSQSEDAKVLIPLQTQAAYNHFGSSGWTRLAPTGDRYASNYQIWSYRWEGNVVKSYVAGLYDMIGDTVIWNTDAMGYVPTPRVIS